MKEEKTKVEFETKTIGALVLTKPVLTKLGFREIVNKHCPHIGEGEIEHGVIAEIMVQSRMSDARALYDMIDWGKKHGIKILYPEIEREEKLNDDRIGRMLDEIHNKRGVIWGELIGRVAKEYEIEFKRLHADTMAMKFVGKYEGQEEKEGEARLEEGYNPQREWVKQLKLFAITTGEGIAVWYKALSGGEGDSPAYVPQLEAFCEHAKVAEYLPLKEIIIMGDGKMATKENQLAWLRANIGYIGPSKMQEKDREEIKKLRKEGEKWQKIEYVAQRDKKKPAEKRSVYRSIGQTVVMIDEADKSKKYEVRHLYIHSDALAQRAGRRRQNEMEQIETELKRIQGIINKYGYITKEIIIQRVQKKAFKKRLAQRYFTLTVTEHPDRPSAPLALSYRIDHQQVALDIELDGVYKLVAGGSATSLIDNQIFTEWKGQYKIEHCFRMLNQLFLIGPIFLKNAQRIVSLVFLIMVGVLIAGLIQRQVQRALKQSQKPIDGLMPEGRDNLRPSIERIFKVFSFYSLVLVVDPQGHILDHHFASLDPVQQQLFTLLDLPHPSQIFAQGQIS